MAEPTEGTYVIVSVSSQKAIDVKGGSDSSGANVQQWNVTKSDAQIWAFTKPENSYWQILCSLTGKCMSVASASPSSGTNVLQSDDKDNTKTQRWIIEDDGGSFTYGSKSYTTYTIKASSASSLALDVAGGSGAAGANIRLWNANGSTAQKWIFIPVSCFTQDGTYELVLASDTNMCCEVAESSTANSANIQVNARADSNNQIFRADVDEETMLVRLINSNSDKCMDCAGGKSAAGTNIQQHTVNGTAAQSWLAYKSGSATLDGKSVPAYTLRAQVGSGMVMDCKGGGKTAKTNIQLWGSNGTVSQKFVFVKSEMLGNDIEMPGSITPNKFSRNDPGDVEIRNLHFASKETKFQARYKIRTYGVDKSTYTDSEWKNLKDDSTSRSGWGDAWTSTFTETPVGGQVALPFSKTVTLSANNNAIDIIIEVRAYKDQHGANGYKAHGPTASTTISVVENPTVSVNNMSVVSSGETFSIYSEMSDSLGIGCTWVRGRLIGSDSLPISGWVSNTDESLSFDGNGTLTRLPNQGEAITLEYSMLAANGASLTGAATYTFNYNGELSSEPTVTYTDDDSFCAIVEAPKYDTMLCFMPITTDFENKLIQVPLYRTGTNSSKWRVTPPLNEDTTIVILAKNSSDTTWKRSSVSVRINAHEFIWTWTNRETNDSCAAVFLNTDAPPQQSRTFTPSVNFAETSARRYPVSFATRMMTIDLSVEAVVVDEDASYTAAGPIPSFTRLSDIRQLIALAGNGTHPIYRTPYGDWYKTAIESVDISKTDMSITKASIKQRAVED